MRRNFDGAPSAISPSVGSPSNSISHALGLHAQSSQPSAHHVQFTQTTSTYQYPQQSEPYAGGPTPNLANQHESPTQNANNDDGSSGNIKRKRGRPKGSKTKNRRIDGMLIPIQTTPPTTANPVAHPTTHQNASSMAIPEPTDELSPPGQMGVHPQARAHGGSIANDQRSNADFGPSVDVVDQMRGHSINVSDVTMAGVGIGFAPAGSTEGDRQLQAASINELSYAPRDPVADEFGDAAQDIVLGDELGSSEGGYHRGQVSDFYQFQYRAMKLCSDFYEAAEDLVRATSPTVLAQSFHSGSHANPMALIHNTKEFCEAFLANPAALNAPPEIPSELFPTTPHFTASAAAQSLAGEHADLSNDQVPLSDVYPASSSHLPLTPNPLTTTFSGAERSQRLQESSTSQRQQGNDELSHGPLGSTPPVLSSTLQDPRQTQESRRFSQHDSSTGVSLGTEPSGQGASPSLTTYSSPARQPSNLNSSSSHAERSTTKGSKRQSSTFVTEIPASDNASPILSIVGEGKNSSGELVGKHVNQTNPSSTHGAWTKEDEDRLRTLVEQSRSRTADGNIEWDWTVEQFGDSRTRHQILIKATSLGLKRTSTHPSRLRKKLSSSTPNLQAAMAANDSHPQPLLHQSSSTRHSHNSGHHQPYPTTSYTTVNSPRRVSSHRHIRSSSQAQPEPTENALPRPNSVAQPNTTSEGGSRRNGMAAMAPPVGIQAPSTGSESLPADDSVSPRMAETQRVTFEPDIHQAPYRIPNSPSAGSGSHLQSSPSGSRDRHRERNQSSSSHQQRYLHGNTGRSQDHRWTHNPQSHLVTPSHSRVQVPYQMHSVPGSALNRPLNHESHASEASSSSTPHQIIGPPYSSTPTQIFHPRSLSQGQLQQQRSFSYQTQVPSVQTPQAAMPVLRHSVSFGSPLSHSHSEIGRSSRMQGVGHPSAYAQSTAYPSQQSSASDPASQQEQHNSSMRSGGSNLDGGLGVLQESQQQHAPAQVHPSARPGYYPR